MKRQRCYTAHAEYLGYGQSSNQGALCTDSMVLLDSWAWLCDDQGHFVCHWCTLMMECHPMGRAVTRGKPESKNGDGLTVSYMLDQTHIHLLYLTKHHDPTRHHDLIKHSNPSVSSVDPSPFWVHIHLHPMKISIQYFQSSLVHVSEPPSEGPALCGIAMSGGIMLWAQARAWRIATALKPMKSFMSCFYSISFFNLIVTGTYLWVSFWDTENSNNPQTNEILVLLLSCHIHMCTQSELDLSLHHHRYVWFLPHKGFSPLSALRLHLPLHYFPQCLPSHNIYGISVWAFFYQSLACKHTGKQSRL